MKKVGSLATYWVHSEDWSDWADAQADLSLLGTHAILLVLSWDAHIQSDSQDSLVILIHPPIILREN